MAQPKRFGRWLVVELISGSSGQAKVWEVYHELVDAAVWQNEVRQALGVLTGASEVETRRQGTEKLREAIAIVARETLGQTYALKRIDRTDSAAIERLSLEIKLLRDLKDPALLPLIDANQGERWFVTKLFPKSLEHVIAEEPIGAVDAIYRLRPIVRLVARLHARSVVHRDIKPANIFVNEDGTLVLGDFGIAFEQDDELSARVTREHERVGSRDWMPPWAQFGRVEELTPAFDVHTLGKVLWSMVTGMFRLPVRFDYKPELLPTQKVGISVGTLWADRIVTKCVGEDADDCLPNAGALLKEFDAAIASFDSGRHPFLGQVPRTCTVCGANDFERHHSSAFPFGGNAVTDQTFNEICKSCGQVQSFLWRNKQPPPAWR